MKTKKYSIKNILLFFSLAIGFQSCQNDLDIYSENAISPEQITESNIQFFLNGLYRTSTPIRDDYFYNDIRGGNYTWTALSGNNSKFGVLITGNGLDDRNAFSSSYWQYCYKNIYNANNIIEAAEKTNNTTIIAEAKYIRAYMYYNLVTIFGGVPLITTNTTANLPRVSAKEIWDQITNDLDYSISNAKVLSETSNDRVSIQASKALKARVLLALNQKTEAANLATEVINESGLKLDSDYGRIFQATKSSSEILFAFANLTTESNTRLSQLFWPYGTQWAGSYFVQPSEYVVNELYETNDKRKEINVKNITNSDGTYNTIISKYTDVQPIIVSRLTEMYFIAAEGYGLGTGLSYLNDVRTTRNLPTYSAIDISSEDAFLNLVLLERRKELYSEGFLFYDLVRTNKAINLPNISQTEQYVLPIPGSQVILSDGMLTQNPGY
ncbi:RagB/SusD family nutrient uptake outer membrane protein [Flavobacterium agricola]|uniref:RagB/SusD family nutrient uptake outer membrane protein n=1 Tax=Flavobacterium agricola TaxID=2870839 RepID=A0ABY6M3H8_9FLAO|nr:RagB/SusD family nutrient uptake outer membrane protein [Flavobacterium agricola]UYW02457.1 RagB/SusD family nutrient uptake outer membrane protein [Flavobacterium agricola]